MERELGVGARHSWSWEGSWKVGGSKSLALAGCVLRMQPTMSAGMLERVSPPVLGADRKRAIAEKIDRR